MIGVGKLCGPRGHSVLYLHGSYYEASPKAISRRTSYLRVRLEFLPYPHVIPTLFNGCGFGPPLPFTATSTCTWIDHPVSGLLRLTIFALLRLGFPSAPDFTSLTSPVVATRRTVLQKVRGQTTLCKHSRRPPTVRRRGVSGSLSLPSRGPFHLSFTVLCAIGH